MKIIRLLTIGNSFAENALSYLEAMANSTGKIRFDVMRANLGGCSLEKHWNLAEYTRRHIGYKTYKLRVAPDGKAIESSLQEALKAASWDYVTLQQVSKMSWRPETFQPYLGFLCKLVRRLAPSAKILLHQTWAYRSDSPFLPQNGLTQELMFKRICAAYKYYAVKFNCGLLPSGKAIQMARHAPGRKFSWPDPHFDYQNAQPPALPSQRHSLTVGWYWAINSTPNGVPELRLDAGHLNSHGRYLAGCVWFEIMTGQDARLIEYRPDEITARDASFLRATAHAACR